LEEKGGRMEKKMSVGVKVMGIIFLLIGIWGLLNLVIGIRASLSSGIWFTHRFLSNIRMWILPIVQTLFLVLSFGIFKKIRWTPILAIMLASFHGLCYVYWLPYMINAERGLKILGACRALVIDASSFLFVICFQVFIIYFFTRPQVKEQFR
jgi:hypothetical protein